MATSATLSFGLAFEAAERNVMNRPPRKTGQHVMDGFAVWRVAFVGSMIAIAAFILEGLAGAARPQSGVYPHRAAADAGDGAVGLHDQLPQQRQLLPEHGSAAQQRHLAGDRRPAADAAGHYLCPADAEHVWYGSAAAALLVCHSGHRRRHVPGGGNREASDAPVPQNGLNNLARLAAGARYCPQGSSMIKTFRFALLACGLVVGALTATAAPAVPVRVATVELAPHAEERAISRAGRGDPRRRHSRAHRRGDCSAPLPGRPVCYRRRPAVYPRRRAAPRGAGSGAGRAEKRRSLITSVAAVAHSLRAAYQQPLHQPQRRR